MELLAHLVNGIQALEPCRFSGCQRGVPPGHAAGLEDDFAGVNKALSGKTGPYQPQAEIHAGD